MQASRQSLYFDYPTYEFTHPRELDGHSETYPVVIVGAGPVGISAALELARHGVKSLVIDGKNSVSEGSRAICIARHSMECFQQLGADKPFLEKALPWTHGTSYYKNREVYRLAMPHSDSEYFYPMYNLQQQYIEKFLIDEALVQPLIELRWESLVEDVIPGQDEVLLNVTSPGGNYQLSTEFLLAADGAHSITRHKLDLPLKGDAYEGRYVIADIQMSSDYPTERRAFFDPPSNPGLTILIHKQPDNIWRIDYQVNEDVDVEEELKEENIRKKITDILSMIGETGSWELEWWSLYKAYTLALEDYRHGRVLFLGDAAHLVPIFGVRGLNSGIADAMNAAWKLAYVIQGWADENLLDSYSPERRGATLEVFENATKSTKFMTPPTRGHEIMRQAVLSLSLSNEFTRSLINPRQSQPYTYIESALSCFRNRDAEFTSGPGTGAPIFNQRIGDRGFLLDYIGKGFSGIYFQDTDTPDPKRLSRLRGLKAGGEKFTLLVITTASIKTDGLLELEDPDGSIFRAYGAVDGSFYLLRPDRHVLARWKQIALNEVESALEQCLKGGVSE